jgi:hypothetical protein
MKLQTKIPYGVFTCSLAVILSTTACQGNGNRANVLSPDDTAQRLTSTVRMNDTKASAQLLNGFYAIEDGAWRWTAGSFSIKLPAPSGAAQRGAILALNFTVPDVVIERLKQISLTAAINGVPLKSAEYDAAGVETFTADVPASMLPVDAVRVDFSVDKVLPPGVDKRALGVIANSISLIAR